MLTFVGSLTSCDSFLNVFQEKGLQPEAICPCAACPEALTVSIRRYRTTFSSRQNYFLGCSLQIYNNDLFLTVPNK